jgi:hypothetical protein
LGGAGNGNQEVKQSETIDPANGGQTPTRLGRFHRHLCWVAASALPLRVHGNDLIQRQAGN